MDSFQQFKKQAKEKEMRQKQQEIRRRQTEQAEMERQRQESERRARREEEDALERVRTAAKATVSVLPPTATAIKYNFRTIICVIAICPCLKTNTNKINFAELNLWEQVLEVIVQQMLRKSVKDSGYGNRSVDGVKRYAFDTKIIMLTNNSLSKMIFNSD